MNETVLSFVVQETKPYYNPGKLEDITRLFLDTLEYEISEDELKGLGNRFTSALVHLATEKQDTDSLYLLLPSVNKMEAYARKVLFITDRSRYLEIRKNNLGFSPVLSALGIKSSQIQSAYDLRNLEAHSCKDWTMRQYYEKITDILVACLKITNKQSQNLKKIIYKDTTVEKKDADNSFMGYIESLLAQFKPQIKSTVQLDSEEDMSMIDFYAVEDTEGKVGRKGSVRDLIRSIKEKRMILWGDAGTGKTTTLEYITYMDAKEYKSNNKGKIPVLIYLGTTTNEHYTIEDYILDKLHIESSELRKLLSKGAINLYLDGFNEIPYTERNMLKTKRRRELSDLLSRYPNTIIVLTNRPQDGKEFSGIPVFRLLEMNRQQVDEFLEKNAETKDLMELVKAAIGEDENLLAMIKRPLILRSLLFIVKTTGEIPKREGQIIGSFLKALFTREKMEKYDEYLDEKKLNLLLRRIGYETFEKYKTNSGVSEEAILEIMSQCEKDYNFTYDNFYALEIIVHLGIMNKRDGQYMFAHQSYQDYYAAQEELAIIGM